MISAMSSGSGKTVMTTAFLLAMKRRDLNLLSFKCGPDYIDPMYHTRVLGIPCRNLDLFLMGSRAVAEELSGDRMPAVSADRASADDVSYDFGDRNHAEGISCDLAVIEGAMGFYDGIGGTARASAYEIASQTTTPVILVVRSKGQSATLAAQLLGMMKFREKNCLAGVIFTECTEGLYAHLKPIVERETGLSVFGYLPKMEEAAIESRHLGLVTAEEIAEFEDRFAKVADQLEKTVDLDGVLRIAEEFQAASSEKSAASARYQSERQIRAAFSERSAVFASSQVDAQFQSAATEESTVPAKTSGTKVKSEPVRIAVARDEAFCFYYESSFEALRRAGAELVWFSPVREDHFPENVHGLYLGGGYPERYASALSENENILTAIRSARFDGMPIVAECGGFLYLLENLEGEDGKVYPMAGVLPGDGFRTKGLRRFGYVELRGDTDSLLFKAGEWVPAHSFHHWDATDPGSGLFVRKAGDVIREGESFVRTWRECVVDESLYAGFPHLALDGELPLAERFVESCRTYRGKNLRSVTITENR